MNALLQAQAVSEAEYLEFCAENPDEMFEFINGEIVAMAGASHNHLLIAHNLARELGNRLCKSGCMPFASDCKVKIGSHYFLPDVVVNCRRDNESEFSQAIVIVEILSGSTRFTDLVTKLAAYRQLPTLQHYLVLEQRFVQAFLYSRADDWQEHTFRSGTVALPALGVELALDDVYEAAVFERKMRIVK